MTYDHAIAKTDELSHILLMTKKALHNSKVLNFENIVFVCLLFVSLFSRTIKHEWNFTAVFAASFAFVIMFPQARVKAFLMMMISMLISDVVIGFHSTMIWVYLGFTLAFVPVCFAKARQTQVLSLITGSSIFFLVSNFGVWFSGQLYSHDLTGLIQCYIMGLPFYQNQFLADVLLAPSLMALISLSRTQFASVIIEQKI